MPSTDQALAKQPKISLLGLLLAILLWWLAAPFTGVGHHDALFYAADALRYLEPKAFAADPFFGAQGQSNYTAFGPLYGELIDFLGIQSAGLLVASAGRLLWLIGALFLVRTLWGCGSQAAWLGAALLLLMPFYYDGFRVFAYGEAIATPRPWAEALVLMALACQLGGRRLWGAVLILAAVALHPLMALPGLVLLVMLQPARLRIGLLLGGSGLALLLASLQWGPFAGLFQRFDPQWWQVVSVRNIYLLPWEWDVPLLLRALLWPVLLLVLGRWHTDSRQRDLANSLGMALLLLLGLWLLGTWLQIVLLVQLQLWRVLWLAQLLAPLLWLSSLPNWQTWRLADQLHVLLLLASLFTSSWGIVLLLVPALVLRHPVIAQRINVLQGLGHYALLVGAVMLVLMSLPARLVEAQTYLSLLKLSGVPSPWVAAVSSVGWLWLLLIGGLIWFGAKLAALRWLGLAAVMGLCGCSAYLMQVQWARANQPLASAQALQQLIPSGALVYWNAGVERTWLLLQRANYASWRQGAASVFSRELALVLDERQRRLHETRLSQEPLPSDPGGKPGPKPVETPEELGAGARHLCQDRALDYVLLGGHLADTQQVRWNDSWVSVFDCKTWRHR